MAFSSALILGLLSATAGAAGPGTVRPVPEGASLDRTAQGQATSLSARLVKALRALGAETGAPKPAARPPQRPTSTTPSAAVTTSAPVTSKTAVTSTTAGGSAVPGVPPSSQWPGAPVVRVRGNTLVNGAGQPLRLVGVDRSGTEYACAQGWGIFDGPADQASVAAMAAWGVDAVRVPLNEDCWLGLNGVNPEWGGANYQQAIEAYVGLLGQAHMVAILDLHWSAPGAELALGQQVMADASHSVAFWSSVAGAFRSDPGVMFDLYNEPNNISWACWADGCTVPATATAPSWPAAGMQSLLDAVRQAGAGQPVIISGLDWANDLSGWLANMPTDPLHQLVAGVHVYDSSGCTTVSCWQAEYVPVTQKVPVVATEVGQADCSTAFPQQFFDWANSEGVSYLAWAWDTWGCPSALVSSYSGTATAWGAALQGELTSLDLRSLAEAPAVGAPAALFPHKS